VHAPCGSHPACREVIIVVEHPEGTIAGLIGMAPPGSYLTSGPGTDRFDAWWRTTRPASRLLIRIDSASHNIAVCICKNHVARVAVAFHCNSDRFARHFFKSGGPGTHCAYRKMEAKSAQAYIALVTCRDASARNRCRAGIGRC